MSSQDEIKVSVCVVTYNQERYIAECLQSLVDQETDFPFEIIVGEDCSTDRTREIVEEFANKYPGLIVTNYHEKNVGAVENAITSYRRARGEYICHIDGDDGALPGKLKRAADVLDANPGYVMVTHDAVVVNNESKEVRRSLKRFKTGAYTIEDLVCNLPFFTNSAKMVRADACIASLPLLDENAIDVELHVLESRFGKIFHLNEPLGYYRQMVGISSSSNQVNSLIVDGYIRLFEQLIQGGTVDINMKGRLIRRVYAKSMLNFSYQSIYFGDLIGARRFCLRSIGICFFSINQLLILGLSFLGSTSTRLVELRTIYKGK